MNKSTCSETPLQCYLVLREMKDYANIQKARIFSFSLLKQPHCSVDFGLREFTKPRYDVNLFSGGKQRQNVSDLALPDLLTCDTMRLDNSTMFVYYFDILQLADIIIRFDHLF